VMYNSSQEGLRCKPFRTVRRDATSAPRKFTQGVSSDTYVVGNATRAFWGSGKAMLRRKARLLLHCTALQRSHYWLACGCAWLVLDRSLAYRDMTNIWLGAWQLAALAAMARRRRGALYPKLHFSDTPPVLVASSLPERRASASTSRSTRLHRFVASHRTTSSR
jgi:hypothetical protein